MLIQGRGAITRYRSLNCQVFLGENLLEQTLLKSLEKPEEVSRLQDAVDFLYINPEELQNPNSISADTIEKDSHLRELDAAAFDVRSVGGLGSVLDHHAAPGAEELVHAAVVDPRDLADDGHDHDDVPDGRVDLLQSLRRNVTAVAFSQDLQTRLDVLGPCVEEDRVDVLE